LSYDNMTVTEKIDYQRKRLAENAGKEKPYTRAHIYQVLKEKRLFGASIIDGHWEIPEYTYIVPKKNRGNVRGRKVKWQI
jgi:hypothetical protein